MFGKDKNASYEDSAKAKICTLIGDGTVFDGDFTSPEAIRVDGVINGNCTCKKQLILGPRGHIMGNISATSVMIAGTADGNISVTGKLELLSTGKVAGDITASSLVIDEGAFFDGRCTMTSAAGNASAASAEDKKEEKSEETSENKPENKSEKKTEKKS